MKTMPPPPQHHHHQHQRIKLTYVQDRSCQQKLARKIFFAIVAKEIIEKKLCKKITYNITKIAKITNLTRNKTQKNRNQKGPRNVHKYRKNRKSNKDFSCQLKTPVTNFKFSIISFATIAKKNCQQIFANKIDPGNR